MKKIILPSLLLMAAITLFSFSSGRFNVKKVVLQNDTPYTIKMVWIGESSKEWATDDSHDVEGWEELTAGKSETIEMDDAVAKEYDLAIIDNKGVYHEWHGFKNPAKITITSEDEAPLKHGKK
jgi:hypothetical protein